MKIEDILPIEAIKIGLIVKSKKELLVRMVELAAKSGKVTNLNEVKKQVMERENLASTAIGEGSALPHTKSFSVKNMCASFALLKTPLNYDSNDEKYVQLVFMLLANENEVGKQLRYLSFFSKILSDQNTIQKILKSTQEREILEILTKIVEEL
jgi:mannitol/fructose-specific phosphotransferase system IIA component (Ntr-type)